MADAILAAFYVSEVHISSAPGSDEVVVVKMRPHDVSLGVLNDHPNEQWSKSLPGHVGNSDGAIELTVRSPYNSRFFEAGKVFVVEFRSPNRDGR